MKRIIIPAVFKAVCCFLILILLTIGFQYIIWLRYEPHYRRNIINNAHLLPSTSPSLTDIKQVREENRAPEKALGIPSHFTPDLWPFDRPMYSGW
jgi:hypothetical protein